MFDKEIMDYLKELDNDPERMPYRRENDKLYDEILAQQIENDRRYAELHENTNRLTFKSSEEKEEFIQNTINCTGKSKEEIEQHLYSDSKLKFLDWVIGNYNSKE